MTNSPDLIDRLTDDLQPVTPIRPRDGITIALVMTALIACAVIALFGLRADVRAGEPAPLVLIRGALLILLGMATTFAAANAARPMVGRAHNGWVWALAAAAILPIVALMLYMYHMMMRMPFAEGDLAFGYSPYCLIISATGGMLVASGLTWWLRRGAPTDIERAAWLVGVASGSFGTFAYSLNCPSNSIYYVGLFYALAVAVTAGIIRLIVPRLIRW